MPALRGVGPPELTLVSGVDHLGILKEESQRSFSARPASFPLRLLPLPDPILVTVPAEDLESFGPPKPFPTFALLQARRLGLTRSSSSLVSRATELGPLICRLRGSLSIGLRRGFGGTFGGQRAALSALTLSALRPLIGPTACHHSPMEMLACRPPGCHYG